MGRKLTTQDVIDKIESVAPGEWCFDKMEYTRSSEKVCVLCSVCNTEYNVPIGNLLYGRRKKCPCHYKRARTHDEFVAQLRAVHGEKYGYDEAVYDTLSAKIKIWCYTCNEYFEQITSVHLSGCDCPRCANGCGHYSESYFANNPSDKVVPGVLYMLRIHKDGESFSKVGISRRCAKSRAQNIRKVGYKVDVISEEPMTLYEAFQREQKVLATVDRYQPKIKFGGHTECFIK